VVADSRSATLEWKPEATIDDESLVYRGVTVLEFAEGRITRSCAYFDLRQSPDRWTRSVLLGERHPRLADTHLGP